MEIELDMRRSVPDNAKDFYERAKKMRGKLEGMEKAIATSKKKLESAADVIVEEPAMRKRAERKWYEKFRWFTSSDGFLVLGGRDATTNEILVKKHLEPGDLVFHAQIQGAPFFIVKNPDNREIPETTLRQAAQAAASYSKAWGRGMGSVDVYSVRPEQVSKSPPAGEYLPKGAFMVYGEKTWHKGIEVKAAVGLAEGSVIGGPPEAVAAQTKAYVQVGVGDVPQGALARQVIGRIGGGELDEIQRHLPPGTGRLL
jgi:predicted ribosome quality control (RQC) complex YloA/Tae2 family protein